jgi:predicted phage gp36 major capsid-like protein
MPLSIPETIGAFRADLRRVELTLGSRIDARVAANETWLRNEVQREREEVSAELQRFREDVARYLAEAQDALRRHVDQAVDGLRLEIRQLFECRGPHQRGPQV